jgi:isopentenyldiphosphate isomerase
MADIMELIDVLTPDGVPTGVRKTKADVHRDGDWHRAVHVWIVTSDGKLLLQRRSHRKENNPGLWDVSAAGHISAGETVIDAAIREVAEELGLRIEAAELEPVATTREECLLNHGTYIDNEIHEIFFVRRDVRLDELTLQEEEVDDAILVAFPQFQTIGDLVPHAEEYAIVLNRLRRSS